jgi:O-antigen/teichoic acid export membrane protein
MVVFIAGRGLSGLLTFVAFGLAARLLSLTEYGYYAAALALMELALALSTGGLDWVSARLVPDSRLHASGRGTAALVLRLAGAQLLLLAGAAAALAAGAVPLARLLQMPDAAPALQLGALLIFAEGAGRLWRDQMLSVLMAQRASQLAQLLRVGLLLALLAWAWQRGAALDAAAMLRLELLAATCAALAGAASLGVLLWRMRAAPAADPGWQPPPRAQLRDLALHAYASYCMSQLYGPQVLTMLVARILGADAAGAFSFARMFADQVRRYLPTDLLQSVVRPTLVAYYSATREFAGLSLRAGLLLKSAAAMLFPLLVFFTAFGDLGMRALGGERFAPSWPVLVVLLCGAGTTAWRRAVELCANTVLESGLVARATLLLVAVPPLMALVLYLTRNLVLAAALPVLAEAAFCLRVQAGLRTRGYQDAARGAGWLRLLAAGLLVGAPLAMLHAAHPLSLPLAVLLAGVGALLALRSVRLLSAPEGALVAGWSGKLARLLGVAPQPA